MITRRLIRRALFNIQRAKVVNLLAILPCLVFCWLAIATTGTLEAQTPSAADGHSRSEISRAGRSLAGAGYRIGPRDRLLIRVDELPSLDSEHQVADDGTITLGVVGSIEVRGLTESELAERIRERLTAEGMRRATVSATVSEYRSQPVSVLGAVARPGNLVIPGRSTLIDVILDAGGLSEQAGSKVVVRRRASNGLTDRVEVAVEDLFMLGDPKANLPIYSGDLIHVLPVREVSIHLLGEVATPGTLSFTDNQRITLLTAIARAGGLAETASKKLVIKREDDAGKRFEIVVDYRKLINGKVADVELQDGDLILVKESFF